ncbi:MAG: TrkH family potassium uptake protein [Ignavibacteriae bacterium]|nr:TrkH family potassium uptake protein [Ignavibacteriota bacterium]
MKYFAELYEKLAHKLSPQSLLVISFVLVILFGAILLMQPFSLTKNDISFVDALYTSASATCVTGLTVVDTGTFFSLSGQIILLFLIQIGGIGVMSFSVLFLFFLKGKFGIGSREIIQETLSFFDTIDVSSLLKSVFIFTITIEAIGAVLLTVRFLFDMPIEQAVFAGIFHSISAFCNAGFSIFPDSLVGYQSDLYVNVVISLLIILGGIGFIVLYEVKKQIGSKFSFIKLSLHSRVVIKISLFLIIIGAVFIFLFEYSVSMKDMNLSTKIMTSIFQSITARTAGFNTIDIYSLSMPSLFLIIILMFIGASPASTGGGIKTATLAVVIAFIRSKVRDSKNVNISFTTLPFKVLSKAIVVVVFAISIIVLFSFLITIVELEHIPFNANGDRFLEIFFEVVSAFGTVGLSTGITPDFTTLGRLLIIIIMLAGRVGPLTVASAIGSKDFKDIKYAEDNILVG